MFTSAGIDNLELRLRVTPDETDALRSLCHYKREDERSFILLNDHKDPKIFLRFAPGKVFADLNVPKLAFGYNVRLAGPEQVKNAIRALETNTNRAASRLNWQHAEVSRLHVTFTQEVQDFEACAGLSKAPRGFREMSKYYPNIYHNSKCKNIQIVFYDKVIDLRDAGLRLPDDVDREMESSEHSLFRFEVRLNQSVFAELKKHGGWNRLSILAEDLCGAGFVSVMQYLMWRFERHVPVPIDRTPTIHSRMSAREYAAHNTRRTANTEQMRERALADHNAGHITEKMLHAELARIVALERRSLAVSLHSALESEVKQTAEILVAINGNLKAPEFEHVARTHRHTDIFS